MTLHEPLADPSWVCLSCRGRNPMQLDACESCGTTFGSLLRTDAPVLSPRLSGVALAAREFAVVLGLYVLWRLASSVSLMDQSGAFARGRWLWRTERHLHLPSELAVQAQVISHPLFVQSLNVFYLAAHIGGMALFLLWMFIKHRERYRRWRNVVVAFTGVSLLLQFVSVAPPRLLPQFGFVDTAAVYHQSAYQGIGAGLTDQLSTMPSIHVGWALIVAIAVIKVCRSRWRWLIVVQPLLTGYAVVATANHFWSDAVAAAGLVGLVLVVAQVASRARPARGALPGWVCCR